MEFHDLRAQYKSLKREIDAGIAEVLEKGNYILGHQVSELEQELARDVGIDYCVTCASGTDALNLAMMMWGISKEDAVFVPDFTFFATAGCASNVGARVIPVDIDPDTFTMSPEALEEAIICAEFEGSYRPRLVIAVDLFGQPADYERISKIALKHRMLLLEDAAQGYGSSLNGVNACCFGDAAITSFFPSKPLGCYGDGGAIFVDAQGEYERLLSLRSNGRSLEDKYDNRIIGTNSRLDTLQAAVLLPKLRALRGYELDALNAAARFYTKSLKGFVKTPRVIKGGTSSWAQYCIMLENEEQRNHARYVLQTRDIPSMVYYPRAIHQQAAYADYDYADDLFPNTLAACKRILALPMHPYISREELEKVVTAVKDSLY